MRKCKTINCSGHIHPELVDDFCNECQKRTKKESINDSETTSGADNDYWVAHIKDPKRVEPCSIECDDLIEHFQMNYQQGEAFKAQWRDGMLRIGMGKPGDTHIRNAEKSHYYSGRNLVVEQRKLDS
jgi:hypothetical protein